uniref:Uncharacterized protein n=1 Tax=Gopherus evgoodei TaxID=1825980 RepID=A0A8C4Y4F4_9SAUR
LTVRCSLDPTAFFLVFAIQFPPLIVAFPLLPALSPTGSRSLCARSHSTPITTGGPVFLQRHA